MPARGGILRALLFVVYFPVQNAYFLARSLILSGKSERWRRQLNARNLNYSQPVQATFSIKGMLVTQGRVFEIVSGNPREYVNQDRPDAFAAREEPMTPPR